MLHVAQFRLLELGTAPQQRRAPQTEVRKPESIADLQKMAVAEWLQSFNSVRGLMERLGII